MSANGSAPVDVARLEKLDAWCNKTLAWMQQATSDQMKSVGYANVYSWFKSETGEA